MAKDLSNIRFLFIELIVWWKGNVTNQSLQKQFHISRQQAYNDFKRYCEHYPNNLLRDEQGYQPSLSFTPHFITGELSQFLHWFDTGSLNELAVENTQLALPKSLINAGVIRVLVSAIENKQRIEASYVSLSHPESDGRIFHPHTFVNTGLRWHIRGYCEKSQGYRDLVLSRFREGTELLEDRAYSNDQDLAWHSEIDIILEPDPRLTSSQKSVLAHDYELTHGQLVIKTRAALASYLLQHMQIKTKMLDGTPEAQQWILVNQDDIKHWLF